MTTESAHQKFGSLAGSSCRLKVRKPDSSFDIFDLERIDTQGKTSITYKAINYAGDSFAIKLVPRERYKQHSIESEVQKVRLLGSRFARIQFYGTPILLKEGAEEEAPDVYAIVMDWIEGITLRSFLERPETILYVTDLLVLCKHLTECLALLQQNKLVHNDLHSENILVTSRATGPHLTQEWDITIIDSGSIKTESLLNSLLEQWNSELVALERLSVSKTKEVADRIAALQFSLQWFSRSDQEWIVSHLVTIYNTLLRSQHDFPPRYRQFIADFPQLLRRMLDPDRSMRLGNPARMYDEIDSLRRKHTDSEPLLMSGPFDLISAELIRKPEQINRLFSSKTPWYNKCATTDPTYIYGPRGCGKSTILRKLSLESVLAEDDPGVAFSAIPYIGVYLSCSAELRSRFWLFPDDAYPKIAGDAVEFFNLLLGEALLRTFSLLRDSQVVPILGSSVGLTIACEEAMAHLFFRHFSLEGGEYQLAGVGWLDHALKALRLRRSQVWSQILARGSNNIPNSSVVFDLCRDLADVFPLLNGKHIAFLLDDYSNQRIPVRLQRILNQTISFAKQGNPIFKVSSEYMGVDLTGIQQGREVVEVNFGKEFVDLQDSDRTGFLEDVIDIRFKLANEKGGDQYSHVTARELLGRQRLSAGTPMARSIRQAHKHKKRSPFHYYGIDTIAELCSGDIAMAIDIVRDVFARHVGAVKKDLPVPQRVQHDVIRECSDTEHLHLRYLTHGRVISRVMDKLCWLAHKSAVERDSKKDNVLEPMIKTSIDVVNSVRHEISDEHIAILDEMIKRGCLFSLDTSRSRMRGEGTERYQIRRILLVKYASPLARRDPIKIDRPQLLEQLLTDPEGFCVAELNRGR
jgi:serine/threonine protein kinase